MPTRVQEATAQRFFATAFAFVKRRCNSSERCRRATTSAPKRSSNASEMPKPMGAGTIASASTNCASRTASAAARPASRFAARPVLSEASSRSASPMRLESSAPRRVSLRRFSSNVASKLTSALSIEDVSLWVWTWRFMQKLTSSSSSSSSSAKSPSSSRLASCASAERASSGLRASALLRKSSSIFSWMHSEHSRKAARFSPSSARSPGRAPPTGAAAPPAARAAPPAGTLARSGASA
mmetsp:Transcript_71185/g.231254  ORF Transcript_71185/g.231254 Transcript_71185/m.231254 type:complete len:239 (+) Transcript_71185:53-769(+)